MVVAINALLVDRYIFSLVVDCSCTGICSYILCITKGKFIVFGRYIFKLGFGSGTGKESDIKVLDTLIGWVFVEDRIFIDCSVFIHRTFRHFNFNNAICVNIGTGSFYDLSCDRIVNLAYQSFLAVVI